MAACMVGTLRRVALRRECPPKVACGHFLLLDFALQDNPSQHARDILGLGSGIQINTVKQRALGI